MMAMHFAPGIRSLVWALMALMVAASIAEAGSAENIFLPLPGKRIRNGARLEIASRWVNGNGYRPMKVTIVNMPPGPTKYDRDFRVRLTPHTYYSQPTTIQTEAIVEMPEGATQATAWIAVPQCYSWQTIDIEVREGGQRIPELSEPGMQLQSNNNYMGNSPYTEAMPSVLFIDSDTPPEATRQSLVNQLRSTGASSVTTPTFDLPDARMWQYLVPQPNDPYNNSAAIGTVGANIPRANDVEILSVVSQNEKVEILHPNDLPDQWLHYTCLDFVMIPLDDATKLAKSKPECWQALLQWAATGPTLIVTGVGDDFDRLAEVGKLAAFVEEPWRMGDVEEHGGWIRALPEFAAGRVRAVDTVIQNEYGTVQPGVAPGNPFGNVPVDTSKPPFAIHKHGLGHVVAMTSSSPLTSPPTSMAWLLNQLDPRNWMNYQRQGISFTRRNSDFMNFLIEGTGRVPVWSFLVLITGFVVVIGPVNYILLKRWRRLFLLLVTVPLGAAIITFSLFSYALISDGLGVRVRARSFTRLDQRTGMAATWARQSYYAGLAPSGGLRFPPNTAVYPIDERPWGGGNRQRELAWGDEVQQLRSGYISSRQTCQFLVIKADKSELKLVFESSNNSQPRVRNELGVDIDQLLVRDQEGKYLVLAGLKSGATGQLDLPTVPDKPETAVNESFASAIKPFSQAYNERRPAAPLGYEADNYYGGLFGFTPGARRNYYMNDYDRGLAAPTFSVSILERELQRNANTSSVEMSPGTYVALLKSSPDMPLGYHRSQERGSFHLLEGRW